MTAARGPGPRSTRSITPVWEGNQTWIVLGLVLLWTAFPGAFAAVMTALFVPLALSLLGILLRGIGFAFRHEAESPAGRRLSGALFAASSLLAPFFLGTSVGAVVTGSVPTDPSGNLLSAWTSATALVTGAMFVCSCAYIGGVYLVGDSRRRGDEQMVSYFSRRAVAAGVLVGVLAGTNLYLMRSSAPYVYHRLLGTALPLVATSAAAGLLAFVLLLLKRQWSLRLCSALAVSAVVAAWGLAQYPYLLPTHLDLRAGSAPDASLLSELAVIAMALVLVVPSFGYLYWLQQTGRLRKTEPSHQLRLAAAEQNRGDRPAPDRSGLTSVLITMVVGASAVELVRERLFRRGQRAPR